MQAGDLTDLSWAGHERTPLLGTVAGCSHPRVPMRDQSQTPPSRMRKDVRDDERRAIESVVGPVSEAVERAVRDARGVDFQRLEFLGDSILDLVLSAHTIVEPGCAGCAKVSGDIGRLVTDHELGLRAAASGLGSWLEWQASPERHADLVEACVAAAWLPARWTQAAQFISVTVHLLGDEVAATLERGGFELDESMGSKPARRLGAAVLELSASYQAFVQHPTADEGQLSDLRAQVHRTSRVATYARLHQLAQGPEDSVVSNAVEAVLARKLLTDGGTAALELAGQVLA